MSIAEVSVKRCAQVDDRGPGLCAHVCQASIPAAADLVWRKRLGRLLRRVEVEQLRGLETRNRQAVHD